MSNLGWFLFAILIFIIIFGGMAVYSDWREKHPKKVP